MMQQVVYIVTIEFQGLELRVLGVLAYMQNKRQTMLMR
jgi:hypothetical protein